jgi:hypothetical protein
VLGATKALDAAERDGAAVVVGGVLETDANVLAALAQVRHVPTILLRAPSSPPPTGANDKRWYVVLGPSTDEEGGLTLGVAKTEGDRAVVEPFPEPGAAAASEDDPLRVRCDATPKTADATAFPVAAWHAKKVATIVVLGDAHCAHHVVSDLKREKTPYLPRLVLSPSALALFHETLPFARTALSAGLLPADDAAPPALQALWSEQKGPIGFFGALGHDAAVIAMAATPGDILSCVEGAAVQAARATTRDRLLSVKGVALWSTERTAIPANGVVDRKWTARQIGAGGAWRPAWASD